MSQINPASEGALTVVLVHGAFADASSWNGVIERLQKQEVPVTAAANPLRSPSHDSAYLASLFDQIPGPVPDDLPDVDRGAREDAIAESWFEWMEGKPLPGVEALKV